MNSLLPRKWTLKRREQQTVHNLFLYLTDTEKRDGGQKKKTKILKNMKNTPLREEEMQRGAN